jgi:hypothetical protein
MPDGTPADRLLLLASFLRAPGEDALDTLSRTCGSLAYARHTLRWTEAGLPELDAPELAGELPLRAGRILEPGPCRAIMTWPGSWSCLGLAYLPEPRAASPDFWECCDPILAAPGQALQEAEQAGLRPVRAVRWNIEALLTPGTPGWLGWLFQQYGAPDAAVLACRRGEASRLGERTERIYIATDRMVPALRQYGASTLDRSRAIPARAAPVPQPPAECLDELVTDLAIIEDTRDELRGSSGFRGFVFGYLPTARLEAIRARMDELWRKYARPGPNADIARDALSELELHYMAAVG